MKKFTKTLFAGALAVTMLSTAAHAETNDKEFAALAKILSLSKDISAGDVKVGVVYDGANAASKADFDAVKGLIGGGFKGPKHNITLEPIAAAEVGSKASGMNFIFITEGVGAGVQQQVHGIAKANKALTATTDMAAVESGNVVLGVDVSGGTVKILMNGNAYRDVGLQFDAAFEFMVKEI